MEPATVEPESVGAPLAESVGTVLLMDHHGSSLVSVTFHHLSPPSARIRIYSLIFHALFSETSPHMRQPDDGGAGTNIKGTISCDFSFPDPFHPAHPHRHMETSESLVGIRTGRVSNASNAT